MSFPVDLHQLSRRAIEDATGDVFGIHGCKHWRRVGEVGLGLCQLTPDADPTVVALFALLHDTQRLNDGEDPLHGPRAAAYAQRLHRDGTLPITRQQLTALMGACERHTSSGPTADPTAGVCFDADRLTLWRVGIIPAVEYLSTGAARTDRRWLRVGLELERTEPMTWEQLTDAYRLGRIPAERPSATLVKVT